MKKILYFISGLFLTSFILISFSCDELITPELADKKVTVTFEVQDTVNVRIYKNYRLLHDLNGPNKSINLRPGSYGVEFYTGFFSYAENIQLNSDRKLNFEAKFDSITIAKVYFNVPDSLTVKISQNNLEVLVFKGKKEIRLKKGKYNLNFSEMNFSYDSTATFLSDQEVSITGVLNRYTSVLNLSSPDSILININSGNDPVTQFRGNRSLRLRKGSYSLDFVSDIPELGTLFRVDFNLNRDTTISFDTESPKFLSRITVESPDSLTAKIWRGNDLVTQFRGNRSLRLKKGIYSLDFVSDIPGIGTLFRVDFNLNRDTTISFDTESPKFLSRITVESPDSLTAKISSGNDPVTQFRGNRSLRLRKGSYSLDFVSDIPGIGTLFRVDFNLNRDTTISFDAESPKFLSRITVESPDSLTAKIRSGNDLVTQFRGNRSLKLRKGSYSLDFISDIPGIGSLLSLNINLVKDTTVNFIREYYGLNFIFVKGGTFQMGSNNGDSDEKPVHSVTLSDFYIGKYEVTQGLWKSVMGSNPSYFKGDDNLPVESVSWYDAVEFCNKLSEKKGLQKVYSGSGSSITMNMNANGYRLPTEAEWEYAARGGSLSKGYTYSGSNNAGDVAWYGSNSNNKTHPVGQKQPNELGIYDMSGNVYEWCWDRYGSYTSGSQTNPVGPSSGSYRVGRGGCWGSYAGSLRSAKRTDNHPDGRGSLLGFRLLRAK